MNRIKNISPKKALGQHFLKDVAAIRRIVAAIPEQVRLMEIGPGTGALTDSLLPQCNKLVLVEKDDQFASYWLQQANTEPRLTLIHADILKAVEEIVSEYSPEWVIGN
ncbi:MAG: rRNA adenine N-6-methyltransferase family protein, partial [Mariprofundaceae bacterium]